MCGLTLISFDSIKIKESAYQRLINILNRETRLNFDYYRRNFIERRIKSRMIRVNCQTLDDYYSYLLANYSEFENFLNGFNINYTYFFRNCDIFEYLQKLFLDSLNYKPYIIQSNFLLNPEKDFKVFNTKKNVENKKNTLKIKKDSFNNANLNRSIIDNQKRNKISRNNNYLPIFNNNNESIPYLRQTSLYHKLTSPKGSRLSINIWSCACASGEEPFSIAMILDNLKNQIPNFPFYKIVGSDIDADALNKAKIGIYDENATKEMSKYFENKYFTKTKNYFGNSYVISEKIKKDVEFIKEDVTINHKRNFKYDIVFCRNLLIYISRENRDKFLRILDDQLNNGCLLILGKTETLFKSINKFKLIDTKNHIYMKTN